MSGTNTANIDERFIRAQVRQGGVLVIVRVETENKVWEGGRVVSAVEVESSALGINDIVRRNLQDLRFQIDLEKSDAEDSPGT